LPRWLNLTVLRGAAAGGNGIGVRARGTVRVGKSLSMFRKVLTAISGVSTPS
jgi:hypothetical protein